MAAVDLSTEELSDIAVSKLGELLAPIGSFTILSPEDPRVKSTGTSGGTYQVEITSSLPTANDNSANYESKTSGAQTNLEITTAAISVMQKLTNLQQQQGIPFKTRVVDASKALAQAVWDKVTAMMGAGSFTDGGSIGASGTLAASDLLALRGKVDSRDVVLLLEHSEGFPIYPTDKNSFELSQSGAYGFDQIHFVSNFTGGQTRQLAFAGSVESAVAISGLPLQSAQNAQLGAGSQIIEQFTIESLGIPVEMRWWINTATRDLYCTMETIFGILAADVAAGAYLTHDA